MTRTALHRLRPAQGQDSGFSLVEVLVAVVVLAVMSLAVFSGLVRALGTSASSRARTVAAAVAAQELEAYDAVAAVPTITEGTHTRDQPVDGRLYKVTTTATWQPAVVVPGTDRCAGPGTGGYPYMRVQVAVTGPGRAPTVRSETLLTPKAGTGPVDSATQRVRVLSRSGAPRAGVQVALSGLTSSTSPATTGTTDSFGCVVFAGLKDGSYRTSVSIAGNVGLAGAQTASRDVTISSATTPRLVELLYDAAAAIEATLPVYGQYPALPRAPLTVVNSGLQPGGQRVQPWTSVGLPVTTTRASSLFPFASGYQAWMGACADADPVKHGRARPLVAPAPGATATVAVPGGAVKVTVYKSGTTSHIVGATVAGHDSCGGTHILGNTTDEAGGGGEKGVVNATLPLGTWRFTVTAIPGQTGASTNKSTPTSVVLTGSTTTYSGITLEAS